MFDRDRGRTNRRPSRRPQAEALESRHLLVATLAPIPAVTVPLALGFQVPLDGGTGRPQTYTVSVAPGSTGVQATVARGQFLTIGVTHASSGAGDPAFSGTLTFQLFEDLTPVTASRIETLVNQGFYTAPTTGDTFPSKTFHRIVANFPGPSDFIVQGGSVNGNGTGEVNQPGFPFSDEFVQQLAFTGSGQLAMANAGDDTNSSQFFITTGGPRFLDFNHTIFGQLVDGQATLAQMTQVARGADGTPTSPILFSSATLSPASPDGVIHLDTTTATAGQATVTVTATDPADATTTSQTFQVTVVADTNNERAFLGPIGDQVVGINRTATFQLTAVNATAPTDTLTYIVNGGIENAGTDNAQFTPVQNATASVDANGLVTVTPNPTFSGPISLVVGVSDLVARPPGSNPNAVANFDTQRITLTVTNNTRPTAQPVTASTPENVATTIQLAGDPMDAGQTLTFSIDSQPVNGTVSAPNAQGVVTYTPRANFVGTDTFTYRSQDVGEPAPSLSSEPATVTITVTGDPDVPVVTGAVRLIDAVLVVTPLPRTDRGTNTIEVTFVAGQISVRVNGAEDLIRPAAADLDRIVVFGAKANDRITVAPDVPVQVTLDGGHGGRNRLQANDIDARLHGWFGRNTLIGGAGTDALIGRRGRVRFVRSDGRDVLFAGEPGLRPRVVKQTIVPPTGTFFRFVRNRLVALPTPSPAITSQVTPRTRRRDEIRSGLMMPESPPPDDPTIA